jgi:hypothetical protein
MCLGTDTIENRVINIDITQRIFMANKTGYGFKKQLNSPILKSPTKGVLYKTLNGPINTYGSE